MQGKSFLDICTGKADASRHRDSVYCEYYNAMPCNRPPAFATMIRSRTHKLVVYHGQELGELYDLKADPDEFENLWDSPTHQGLKCGLMKQCFDAGALTLDPLPVRVAGF